MFQKSLYKSFLASLSLLITACGGPVADNEAPLLNSERIEARFGSYGVEVLQQDRQRRISCLYSHSEGERICRSIAVVLFNPDVPDELGASLDRIRAGASLGATLAEDGWTVQKRHRHVGLYTVADGKSTAIDRHFRTDPPASFAVHVYDLSAARQAAESLVATLIEVHHPEYLDVTALQRIYRPGQPATLPPAELERWLERLDEVPPPFN